MDINVKPNTENGQRCGSLHREQNDQKKGHNVEKYVIVDRAHYFNRIHKIVHLSEKNLPEFFWPSLFPLRKLRYIKLQYIYMYLHQKTCRYLKSSISLDTPEGLDLKISDTAHCLRLLQVTNIQFHGIFFNCNYERMYM